MNPWIVITLFGAIIVFGIDYLLRGKKWKDQLRGEKISLLINMFTVGPHIFLSGLGMLWGITGSSPDHAFWEFLYNATLMMGSTYFIVAIVAVIGSLILRKKGKIKASIWIQGIALLYIIVVLAVNYFVGEVL